MNSKILLIIIIGLILSTSGNSASIYKCTGSDKKVIFTDKECPANTATTLIHKETEQEIANRLQAEKISTLKRLIAGNQVNVAKEYAIKNNLSEVYYEQLSLYSNQKIEAEKRNAALEKEQQLALQQQALAIQRQQVALEKSRIEQQQQSVNNRSYYAYPYYYSYSQGFRYSYQKHTPATLPQVRVSLPISSGRINSHALFPASRNVEKHFHHR